MNVKLWFAAILIFSVFLYHIPSTHADHSDAQEQSAPKSAREQFGLRGPVRTCTEEWSFPDGKGTFSNHNEFTPDGKMLESRSQSPDGSEWVEKWTYDADGRLLKTASGKSGEPASQALFTYDDAGRLVSITNSDNKDRTDVHYDERGHKTEVKTFDPKTLERAQNIAGGSNWYAVMGGSGVPGGGSVVTIYDDNNRAVEEQVRDAEDYLVSRVVRTYNPAGQVAEEKPILENPDSVLDKLPAEARSELNSAQMQTMTLLLQGQAQSAKVFTYDGQGRVLTERQVGGVMQSATTTTYNEKGDIAERRSTLISAMAVGAEYSIAENGTLTTGKPMPPSSNVPPDSDEHFTYQYDNYGNWTQQSITDQNHPEVAATIRHRTLTYY